jgi:hypothetical protein
MIKRAILILALLITPNIALGQVCTPGQGGWVVTTSNITFTVCNSDGSAWLTVVSGGVLSGTIILSLTSCPTGYTEATELNGKTLVGTLAANKDVGTTGGADNITPAGTNAAITAGTPSGTNSALTFTGTPFTSVINHTHAVTSVGSAATGGTTNLTGASDTSSTTATAANPAGGVSSITPAGTINIPTFTGNALGTHNHTFTGTQFDNRSAYVKVIFCRKT